MEINVDKSQLMVTGKGKPNVYMKGLRLEEVSSFK